MEENSYFIFSLKTNADFKLKLYNADREEKEEKNNTNKSEKNTYDIVEFFVCLFCFIVFVFIICFKYCGECYTDNDGCYLCIDFKTDRYFNVTEEKVCKYSNVTLYFCTIISFVGMLLKIV